MTFFEILHKVKENLFSKKSFYWLQLTKLVLLQLNNKINKFHLKQRHKINQITKKSLHFCHPIADCLFRLCINDFFIIGDTFHIFGENVNPANIYWLKVNNRNIKKRCEICLKLKNNTRTTLMTSTSTTCFYC